MNIERINRILSCSNPSGYDSISYDKRKILEDIFKDRDIIELLHNTELEKIEAIPEDYYNINIFSFLKIPDAQSEVKNFLCFEVDDINISYTNKIMVTKQIIFRTISHKDDVETPWGANRQDLLAALIKERFQWSNILGTQLIKTYDSGKVAENGYYYRTMYFQQTIPNDLQGTSSNRLDKVGRDHYAI